MAEEPKKRGEYRRKWLVVVDETEECDRALTFAGYRLRRTGGTLLLLTVIQPDTFQHWIGVENVMRAEAMRDAEKILDERKERVAEMGDIKVETIIREGRPAEEIEKLIEADDNIAILVLAASASSEGPGPLVSAIANRGANAFPIPVAIVPGNLTDEEIEALT